MAKNQTPSKKSIREALLEGLFDPREKSPMSVVVSMQDPGFIESKAIELIYDAKLIVSRIDQTEAIFHPINKKLMDEYQEKISQALSLLALAKVQRNGAVKDAKT